MRIGLLGGGGHIGKQARDLMLGCDFVGELIVADIDYEAASRVAGQSEKCHAVRVDIASADLAAFVSECDIVVNLAGPYYRHGVKVLKAAIDGGRHYIDINDDWEPTLDMLALDLAARDAGVSAVIGMGSSPGLTNMLAAKIAKEVDDIDRLFTGWTMAGTLDQDELIDIVGSDGKPSAAMVHWLQQVSGMIEVVKNGTRTKRKPVEEIQYSYPGIGDCVGWTIGHPEPMTFLSSYPGVRESYNLMGINTAMAEALREIGVAIDSGRCTVEEAALLMLEGLSETDNLLDAVESGPVPPIIFAVSEGRKDGQRIRVSAHLRRLPPGLLDAWTGAPLAVGTMLLAEKKVAGAGVMAPEKAFDPEIFFENFEPFCDGVSDGRPLVDLRVESI